MVARSDFVVSCSLFPGSPVPFVDDDCNVPAGLPFLHADDCACPADGLCLPDASAVDDPALLQAVRLFLAPVDEEYSVGYSPFVPAGRSS